MRRMSAMGLFAVTTGLVAQTPVPARSAAGMSGQFVVVEDTVAEAARPQGSRIFYLNFGAPFPNQVLSVLVPSIGFPDVSLWRARRVRVRGMVVEGVDGPMIACSEPGQPQLLDWVAPATVAPLRPPAAAPVRPPADSQSQRTRCRVCTTGKPCGNSCIARSRTCRQLPGCAC
jgi:hypothetical protein